jgi:hypothetical protein
MHWTKNGHENGEGEKEAERDEGRHGNQEHKPDIQSDDNPWHNAIRIGLEQNSQNGAY